MRQPRRCVAARAATVVSGLALLGLVACAPSSSGPTTVHVFAAASLEEPFTRIAADFEADHPETTVALSFNGSSTLVTQIAEGAPADVFAAADEQTMERAVEERLVESPETIATNRLALVVRPGNPQRITGLDASLAGSKLVTCAPGVPCGNALQTLQDEQGLELRPVSQEHSVTDVLGKVTSGEADAGVVYVTDARRAGQRVTQVPIRGAEGVVNRYPIAVTSGAREAALARDFVDEVIGPRGREQLAAAGFGTP